MMPPCFFYLHAKNIWMVYRDSHKKYLILFAIMEIRLYQK